MKQYNYIGIMMMAAAMAATSCTDFDDYNTVPGDGAGSGATSQSVWENICSREDLTEFAALVKKSGYDKELSSARFYTVWAPLNGQIDSKWATADSATLRFQFVENHLADYNHYISAPVDERIKTLNEKSYTFAGTSSDATFGGVKISKANIPGVNGVLHLLDGEAEYRSSIYEYLSDRRETDSLAKFTMKYEYEFLDENNSVLGPMVDGLQTYEDSVMITTNDFFNRIRAYVSEEDSSYTIIMPTNEAWKKQYTTIKNTLNYANGSIKAKHYYMDRVTFRSEDITDEVDAAYLSDSLTRQYLTVDLVFSNNDKYNKKLVGGDVAGTGDTLRSTNTRRLTQYQNILSYQQGDDVLFSNGVGHIVDSLAFAPWQWYKPVSQNMKYAAYQSMSTPTNVSTRYLRPNLKPFSFPGANVSMSDGTFTTSADFTMFKGSLSGDRSVYFHLGHVHSSSYRVYCIIVPPDADLAHASYDPEPEMLPTLFNASVSYYDPASGLIRDHYFLNDNVDGTSTAPKASTSSKPGDTELSYAFVSDMDKIDAVYLGDFTFPVSYYQLPNCSPAVKIVVPRQSNAAKAEYTRVLRIAGIVLIPTELSTTNDETK